MRIITGQARGKQIKTLAGDDVRPTSEKVKEAIFSIIHFHLPGAQVLDVFAGSGQLGLEALSRGAKKVCMVDNSQKSCSIVSANIRSVGLSGGSVYHDDAFRFMRRTDKTFDIILIDPPYSLDLAQKAVVLAGEILVDDGFIIAKTEKGCKMPTETESVVLKKKYKHGTTDLWLYRKDLSET